MLPLPNQPTNTIPDQSCNQNHTTNCSTHAACTDLSTPSASNTTQDPTSAVPLCHLRPCRLRQRQWRRTSAAPCSLVLRAERGCQFLVPCADGRRSLPFGQGGLAQKSVKCWNINTAVIKSHVRHLHSSASVQIPAVSERTRCGWPRVCLVGNDGGASCWCHELQSIAMALAEALHHSAGASKTGAVARVRGGGLRGAQQPTEAGATSSREAAGLSVLPWAATAVQLFATISPCCTGRFPHFSKVLKTVAIPPDLDSWWRRSTDPNLNMILIDGRKSSE